jgi:hypothetical protein
VTCGEGYRFRKRECLSADDKNRKISTDNCVGKDIEIQPCDITTCPSRVLFNQEFMVLYEFICFSLRSMDTMDTMFNFLWYWYKTT